MKTKIKKMIKKGENKCSPKFAKILSLTNFDSVLATPSFLNSLIIYKLK